MITTSLASIDVRDAIVATHCTGSSLARVAPQLLELVDAGLNVVSTCEELSYPWTHDAALAAMAAEAGRTGPA